MTPIEHTFATFATAIGALGTFMALLVLLIRVGKAIGEVTTSLGHMSKTQDALAVYTKDFKKENAAEHRQIIEQDTDSHGHFASQILDITGRVGRLEGYHRDEKP